VRNYLTLLNYFIHSNLLNLVCIPLPGPSRALSKDICSVLVNFRALSEDTSHQCAFGVNPKSTLLGVGINEIFYGGVVGCKIEMSSERAEIFDLRDLTRLSWGVENKQV